MFRLLVLLLAVTCVLGGGLVRRPLPDGRIVGGTDARIEDFPYQLSLRSGGSHICGASIINANYAVTAAHCVSGASASSISFRAGSNSRVSGGTIHNAASITVHKQYNSGTIDYDIAVVQVKEPFPVGSSGVKAIKPTNSRPSSGTQAVASGWGTLSSGGGTLPTVLQKVDVPIVGNDKCNGAYGGGITDRMICAGYDQGGKDACQGDSGGPLVANNQLVGIVSWGYGCAVAGYPGVYTNVATFSTWIDQNTR